MVAPTTESFVPSWLEPAGAMGLGIVWGWLLVQLAAASRPTPRGAILSLIATAASLGVVLLLVDIRAVATCAAAIGVAVLLHAHLIAALRTTPERLATREMTGGEPR